MTQTTIRQAVMAAGTFVGGHFVFADGDHATRKIEMDHLWDHAGSLHIVLTALARAQGLPTADVIVGVPTGGQRLAVALTAPGYTGIPVVRLERVPGGGKKDFRFLTPQDQLLASTAASVRIYEDVVSTLSSVAGVVKLFEPARQTIHSLAIWRRGTIRAQYRHDVTDHYLVESPVPNYSPSLCPVCRPFATSH